MNLKAEHVLVGTPGAVYTGTVKVVMDGAPVPGAYEEVAIVTATGASNAASLPAVLGALQGETASLGCDTLVRVRYDRGAESDRDGGCRSVEVNTGSGNTGSCRSLAWRHARFLGGGTPSPFDCAPRSARASQGTSAEPGCPDFDVMGPPGPRASIRACSGSPHQVRLRSTFSQWSLAAAVSRVAVAAVAAARS